MSKAIAYLCKVFSAKAHAENFLSGSIWLTRLTEFRHHEDPSRKDPSEGVFAVHQSAGATIDITPPGGNTLRIGGDGPIHISGPIRMCHGAHLPLYVLCMYAATVDADTQLPADELRKRVLLPDECKKWGEWVVILTNGDEFAQRLERASTAAGFRMLDGGLVEYYDAELINGRFKDEEVFFRKEFAFSHESEYRFLFSMETSAPSPVVLRMPVQDIALLMTISELNQGIKVTPKP